MHQRMHDLPFSALHNHGSVIVKQPATSIL
jgi:hypothetical protein